MADYEPIDLSGVCNAGLGLLEGYRQPPVGEQVFHGLPFRIGNPQDAAAPCFVALRPGAVVTVPVQRAADHVIVAHRRLPAGDGSEPTVGNAVAEYTFRLGGSQLPPVAVPIRERLEIAVAPEEGWDASGPFLAASSAQLRLADRDEGRWEDLGMRQSEAVFPGLADYFLWVWENSLPAVPIEFIRMAGLAVPVLVAAITLGAAGEHPLPREAARAIRITALGPDGPRSLCEPAVQVDRGVASYAFRLPGTTSEGIPDNPLKGWGEQTDPQSPHAYARVAAVPSATVTVADGEREIGRFRWRDLAPDRPVEQKGLRVTDAEPGRNWVHVTVLDDATGRPVPCRVAFRSPEGIPYQPHGHHNHVNSDLGTWHIDIGGDVRLGRLSYAYIDGSCQGWLPTGDVLVDVARGFEYEPLRERIRIAPGQRELTLRIRRWTSMSAQGWYSGDSHVHFLSAQGALTEQQGEDLNVVNLLQSQWGSLFTGTEEFTGSPVASPPGGRYVTWVSQENRQPFFGHLVLWGLQRPIMPWCTDGPNEAELGGWLETTVSDWADRCHAQGGTVVIPHFPLPNGEPAVLIATGRADAIEMIVQRRAFHEEYYSYLNCGYRLPLVGGTDKMTADVPVGVYRTYAKLGEEEFSYGAWSRSVRAGRTFLSAGPIIDLRAEGCQVGDTLRVSGPGTINVSATAEGIFPVWALQIVQNGRVVASAEEPAGARRIELQAEVRVEGHCWLAARCGGPHYWDAPSHLGPWPRGIFAHTSPVYVACGGGEWSQFDAGQARTMLELIEGGLQRVRRFAIRYPEGRISHQHGEADHNAFLERPFLEALDRVRARLERARPRPSERDQ